MDQNKHVVFWGFLANFEQKNLENFLTSSMYGLIFMILGHGGSLKGKSGQILEYQASQLAISIHILLSSYCHFDLLREGTKKII